MLDQTRSAPQRGWYYGWNIVAVCVLSQVAANGLSYNALSLFLRDWSAQLHTPISRLQLTVPAMVLLASLCAPLVGIWADKYPARRLLSCGLLGMAIFYVAVGSATTAWQLLALYGLMAPLALTLATAVPANALISRWFVRRLGFALGLSAFGIGMAGVLLPPLIAAILPSVGWRAIWRIGAAVLVLFVIPVVLIFVRDRPQERDGTYYLSTDGASRPTIKDSSGSGRRIDWRIVLGRRTFWLLLAIYLPMMALYGGCAQNLAPLAASRGLSQQTAGLLLSVLSFSHLIATPICGVLSDRFGNRLPFAGLALVISLGALILIYGTNVYTLGAACVLVGFGGGLFTLLGAVIATEFGAEAFGRVYGLSMLFVPVATLAPYFVARMQESTGSYTVGFVILIVLVLISGVLSLKLQERSSAAASRT